MIKKFFKHILNLISRCIFLCIPKEIRDIVSLEKKKNSIHTMITENTTKECYEYFKEIFKTTVLFEDGCWGIRKYAI
jgi:hypothetical protein